MGSFSCSSCRLIYRYYVDFISKVTKQIHAVFENTRINVKAFTKLTNSKYNHELNSIEVNKCSIHGELSTE